MYFVLCPELWFFLFITGTILSFLFSFAFIRTLPPVSDEFFTHPPALPKRTRSCPDHCLVLDLDETLVHCSLEPLVDAKYAFQVVYQDVVYMVSSLLSLAFLLLFAAVVAIVLIGILPFPIYKFSSYMHWILTLIHLNILIGLRPSAAASPKIPWKRFATLWSGSFYCQYQGLCWSVGESPWSQKEVHKVIADFIKFTHRLCKIFEMI